MCELRFTILSPTSQSTVCGPEDVASRYPAVPPLDCAVDRTGRLGLGRRSDSLTRANPAYTTTIMHRQATADAVDLPGGP
jgi:hypothetical protein